MERIIEIDAARGIAIMLMVVYHFFFDLWYFGIGDIDLTGFWWSGLQRFIGTLFILIVGVSLALSESANKEGYSRHAKKALRLGAVALLITAATWVYPHEGFIRFGIIHMIALSTLIAPFFFKFGRLNVVLGILIILAGFYTSTIRTDSGCLFWLGITSPDYHALDHYPILPWFGVVLIGMDIGQKIFVKWNTSEKIRKSMAARLLSLLGRNALLVYLIHQPLMLGAMLLFG